MAKTNVKKATPLKLLLLAAAAAVLVGCNGGKDGIQFASPTVQVKGLSASNAKALEYEYDELTLAVQLGQHEDALLEFAEDGKETFERKIQDRKSFTLTLNTSTDLCGFEVEGEEGTELEPEVSSKQANATFVIQCEEPEPPESPEEDDEEGEEDDNEDAVEEE